MMHLESLSTVGYLTDVIYGVGLEPVRTRWSKWG